MRGSRNARLRCASLTAALAVALSPLSAGALVTSPQPQENVAKADGPITLVGGPVWVPLTDAETGAPLTGAALTRRLATGRAMLVLDNLSADAQPGSPFAVYLGLASTAAPAKPATSDPHYVGRFAFFNEINEGSLKATPSRRSYDVTALLGRLRSSGSVDAPIGVTIAPEREPAAAVRATIGRIDIVIP
jgi:hypothetical protein